MDITINNIGIVSNSTLKIEGLTVITGKNNSGKTTVGKVLYSIIDAVSNLTSKAKQDRAFYIRKRLEDVTDIVELFRFYQFRHSGEEESILATYPAFKSLISNETWRDQSAEDIEGFAKELLSELKRFDISPFEKSESFELYRRLLSAKDARSSTIVANFNDQKAKAIGLLESMFEQINKDIGLVDYARESINQTLRVEFSNQIQPISHQNEASTVRFFDKDTVFIDFSVGNDKVINNKKPVFFSCPFKNTFLVDNPFVLDASTSRRTFNYSATLATESFLNSNRILSHSDKLRNILRNSSRPSVLEQTVLDQTLAPIKRQIDEIIPGTFEFSSSGEYYIQDGKKLKVANLATGSKMISIIKILLEMGRINNETMLILDEPEAHLHPEWQNAFAEVIALLVKELGVKILLTTHSPNFMLAIDAYMRKYKIENQTNFYQTDFLDNGMVTYHCVNDNLGIIYEDFLQYLSKMKMLRSQYFRGIE